MIGSAYLQIAEVMSEETGAHFTSVNHTMIKSRIDKRIMQLKLKGPNDYLKLIKGGNSRERTELVSLLTTHYTYFMRETNQFNFIINNLSITVERIKKSGRNELKIWCAACSKGDEVYSLAMMLKFHLNQIDPKFKFSILGTDICRKSVGHANEGVYLWKELSKVPPKYLKNNWLRGTGAISDFAKVTSNIKEHCNFKYQNIVDSRSSEFGESFDIILCRNVFIYFNENQINEVVKNFKRCVYEKGHLFVGISENLSSHSGFTHLGQSIYVRSEKELLKNVSRRTELSLVKSPSKVLIIDDSNTIRKLIRKSLENLNEVEIIGEACDGQEGLNMIKELKPDIITLDINMPKVNGLELLKKMSPLNRPETVLISSISKNEGDVVMQCLENGAHDYLKKPSFDELDKFKVNLKSTIENIREKDSKERYTAIDKWSGLNPFSYDDNQIIAIGASTGGTEAIKQVLLRMPKKFPPIVIVQHIPPVFSTAFAKRLNEICPFKVFEAVDGMKLEESSVYIAPGGKQMSITGTTKLSIQICEKTGKVSGHKPSVDHLFYSLSRLKKHNICATLLTGMGSDGAKGLLKLKDKGDYTITQSKDSCVVYGMPKKADELGASMISLALDKITAQIVKKSSKIG